MSTRHNSQAALRVALAVALICGFGPSAAGQSAEDARPVVRSQADLPRHLIPVSVPTVIDLLTDDEAFAAFAPLVQVSLEQDLASYVIEDRATLRGYHRQLADLALLRGDYDQALHHTSIVADLQEKPASQLMTGVLLRSFVAAERAGGDSDRRQEAFRTALASEVADLPWAVVQDAVMGMKGQAEILTRNLLMGQIAAVLDEISSAQTVSGDIAGGLVEARVLLDYEIPYGPAIVEVLQAYIAANRVEKPDIWLAREVSLEGRDDLHPVVIGIWDGGVDPDVFGERVLRSPAGDVAHVAFSRWTDVPAFGPLIELTEEQRARYPTIIDFVQGWNDLDTSIDSPQAAAVREYMASLEPEQVKPFLEEMNLFGSYTHGTHVAGIAVRENPAARLVTIRETFSHSMVPPPFTREVAEQWAENMQEAVDYLKASGARIVNMSWGGSPRGAEVSYELNGIGESAEERRQMAIEVFDIVFAGMRRAMESAPEILFIPAGGNFGGDVQFSQFMPGGIVLPNVLTVGAVDQAGEETGFTAYGSNVRIHANGYQVESYFPGGARMQLSGTSMAAPNVANLAGKMLALDPSLSPEEVIGLIVDGADQSEDGRRFLMNPRRSMELLAMRTGSRE